MSIIPVFGSRIPTLKEIEQVAVEDLIKPYFCGCLPIHHAIRENSRLPVIQALIARAPNSLMQRTRNEQLALHFISSRTSLDVVKCIVKHSETTALLQEDVENHVPLHTAFQSQASVEILDWLMDQCPDKVFGVKNRQKWLPIHVALYKNREQERVGLLTEATLQRLLDRTSPGALIMGDVMGRLPLHCLSGTSLSWDAFDLFLRQCPPEAFSAQDLYERFALEYAVNNDTWSVEMVERLLVEIRPRIFLEQDKNGRTLLHRILTDALSSLSAPGTERFAVYDQVLQCVVAKSPLAAFELVDTKGNLPIHCLGPSLSHDLVQLIIERSSSVALLTGNLQEHVPLHCAVLNHASFDVVQLLVKKERAAISARDKAGVTPLYYTMVLGYEVEDAAQCEYRRLLDVGWEAPEAPHRRCIRLFLEEYPDVLSQSDLYSGDGKLPLFDAVEWEVLELMDFLFERYRDALKRQDSRGQLCLHRALSKKGCSRGTIDWLVRRNPSAVHVIDASGLLPLHVACATDASVDIILTLLLAAPDQLAAV